LRGTYNSNKAVRLGKILLADLEIRSLRISFYLPARRSCGLRVLKAQLEDYPAESLQPIDVLCRLQEAPIAHSAIT